MRFQEFYERGQARASEIVQEHGGQITQEFQEELLYLAACRDRLRTLPDNELIAINIAYLSGMLSRFD